MSKLNPLKTLNFDAAAAITGRRIVKLSSDSTVSQAAAATDLSFGVATSLDAASGEPVDVIVAGVAEVEYGGAVTRGQKLTSDADGKAVAAAPAAGVNNQIIGIAMVSGVLGDYGAVLIAPSTMQGA
jgi:hypothetical protein